MTWSSIKLKNAVSKLVDNRGKTPPWTEHGIDLIETASLVGERKFPDYSSVTKKVSQSTYDSWFRAGHPQKDDLLVATVGANIGRLAIMKLNRGCVAQNLVGLRIHRSMLEPHFLYYFLSWDHTQTRLKNLDIGAAQPSIKVPHLLDMEVPTPPLPTQRKIASILSAYDDLIENNTRRIAILEEMAQAIYREWLVNFRYPGHENVKLVDSPLGQIPEGWRVVKLKEMYPTSSGGTPSRKNDEYYDEGTINWVKTKELKDRFVWDTEEKITVLGLKNSSAKIYPKYTVLMAMYGATIGQLGILGAAAATNQACCAFRVHESDFGYPFLFLYLRYNRAEIISLGAGAAQQNVSQDVIREIELVRPSLDVVQKFNDRASPLLLQIFTLQKATSLLRTTRDLLLPKLISGQLDVEDLDIDVSMTAEELTEAAAG